MRVLRFLYWLLAHITPRPKQIPSWEPKAKDPFRKRPGFIDRRPEGDNGQNANKDKTG